MELISNCSKVAGCKVNIRKAVALLYTWNKQVEFEIINITIYISTLKNELDMYKYNKICIKSI